MLSYLWTTAQNVLTLFLLIGVGVCCKKFNLLTDEAIKGLANLALYVATPCVVINSCLRDFDFTMFKGFLIVAAAAIVQHGLLIGIAHLVFRGKKEGRKRVLRFATVFSNAGYMAIPLQQAIIGDEGVFYCSAYIIVFNILLWTYGVVNMTGNKKELSVRKILVNPGIIAVLLGLLVFLLPIPVPPLVRDGIQHLANLNTPVPMLIIGYYLAQTDFRRALQDKQEYLCILLRLIVTPLIALALLLLCGVHGTVLVALMICISTPVATACSMFAARYDLHPLLSVNLVSMSTLFSVITLPVMITFTTFFDTLLH